MLVGYATSIVNCSSPVFHVLTDRLMAPMFRERKIAPEILPRCIEDSRTLAGPTDDPVDCIYMSGTLGMAWGVFFPYLFLLYLTPVFGLLHKFAKISTKHISEEET